MAIWERKGKLYLPCEFISDSPWEEVLIREYLEKRAYRRKLREDFEKAMIDDETERKKDRPMGNDTVINKSKWRPLTEKPLNGSMVGIIDIHKDNEGLLSSTIEFWLVNHCDPSETNPYGWFADVPDSRGGGWEMFHPGKPGRDEFRLRYWIDAREIPPLPTPSET